MRAQDTTKHPLAVCASCGKAFRPRWGKPNRTCSQACKFAPRPLTANPDDPDTLIVPLTRGKVAIIDRADWLFVAPYRWSAILIGDQWYATRTLKKSEGRGVVMLHQALLSVRPGYMVDHVDLDGLNNRRSNLREARKSENMSNRPAQRNNTSGFKGVDWDKAKGRWRAQIAKDRRHYHIGNFDTAEEAARAYDKAARRLHGRFARLNFPDHKMAA